MTICLTRREVGKERKEKIRALYVEKHAIRYGEFTLASGQKSKYYFDSKMVTTDPEAAYLIAQEIFEELKDANVKAVGGLTIGAALMVSAVSIVSKLAGKPIPAFVVREQRKEHGTRKFIEGQLPKGPGARVAIIDDVMTTGTSVLEAIKRVEEEGCQVVKVIILLDRQQGGGKKVRELGYDLVSILHWDPDADSNGKVTVDEPTPARRNVQEGALSR